ncbi:PTS system mannose/fructose/N-acetylgalactosamine-transporter subunit IIB [Calditrichota bacterium GD2]
MLADIQLFRIDDRLIHGQVVIGWANFLNSREIILCDDLVAQNVWEKELYLSSVPDYLSASVVSTGELADHLNNDGVNFQKAIILVNSPFVIEKLLEKGAKIEKVNVGGIHFKEGRREFLPYLFLNEEEVKAFWRLIEKGIYFYCQDVPSARAIPLEKVLPK